MRERIRQRTPRRAPCSRKQRPLELDAALSLLMLLLIASATGSTAFLTSSTARRLISTTSTTSSITTTKAPRTTTALFARCKNKARQRTIKPEAAASTPTTTDPVRVSSNKSKHHSPSVRRSNHVVTSIRSQKTAWNDASSRTSGTAQAPQSRTSTSTSTARTSNPRRTAQDQFQPRHAQYERERLHGRRFMGFSNNSTFAMTQRSRTNNQEQASLLQERHDLTEKIRILLSDDSDDDSFLASQTIADRDTVFSKLSDMDKSQAAFAVSKRQRNGPTAEIERVVHPTSTTVEYKNRMTKKPKIMANVLETGQDTMHHYVKSMGQHQVLSAQDEQVLGRQIQLLVKWEEKRQTLEETLLRAPTFQEWADAIETPVPDLKKQIRRSQQAKHALVEANLRLVVTVARQTVRKGRSEINFQDACQEGILGLTRASEKFDPEKGFRFSSYAVWWIKKRIHLSVTEQARSVRLPPNVIRKINDIRIHEKVLQDELGRKAFDDEVANKVGMSVEQLEFYRKSANEVISLDKKVKFNKESDNASNVPTMHSMVSDPGQSPAELAQKQSLQDDVGRLILTLSPREQAVIRMRFGLDNGSPRTLQQIGDKFSVDKEVIRKIEARALRKMRQPYRNQSLKSYIADL